MPDAGPQGQPDQSPPATAEPPAKAPLLSQIGTLFRQLGPAGKLGIAWTAMPPLAGLALLWKIEAVSQWLRSQGHLGIATYVLAFMVLAGLGMLPTYAQAILGGWCFGMAIGLPAALAGFAGASLIGYAIARTVSRHRVENLIAANPKSRAVREALIGHGFFKTLGIVALLRLPPNSPFALTNLVMASAGVRLAPFLIGTLIGMMPRTALAVYLGSGLKVLTQDSIREAEPSKAILIGGIVLTIIVVLVIGQIASRAIARVTSGGPTAKPA